MRIVVNSHIQVAGKNTLLVTERAPYDLEYELYWWVDFFNAAFFKHQSLPRPILSFERTRITNLGYFDPGPNAFGVQQNINLNAAYLNRPIWEILATLLHQMTHSWQVVYGKPSKSWFHNKEFRQKMAVFGLSCDAKGHLQNIGDPYRFYLQKHSIVLGPMEKPGDHRAVQRKLRGSSTLKKWSCGCTNVRVASGRFSAKCMKCAEPFKRMN